MKILHRISIFLIAIPLLATLWSSVSMIFFVQHERLAGSGVDFYYGNLVHEAGFARLTLAVIGLLVLFIPYRNAERWAFAALALLMICYEIPVFLFGSMERLGSWPIFRNLAESTTSSIQTMNFERYFFTIVALSGLAIAIPIFARKRKHVPIGGV